MYVCERERGGQTDRPTDGQTDRRTSNGRTVKCPGTGTISFICSRSNSMLPAQSHTKSKSWRYYLSPCARRRKKRPGWDIKVKTNWCGVLNFRGGNHSVRPLRRSRQEVEATISTNGVLCKEFTSGVNLNGPWKQDQTTEGRGGVVIISASTSPVNNMVAIKTETRTSHRKMDLTFFFKHRSCPWV